MDKFDVLKNVYNYSGFRNNQEEIIDSLLSFKDTVAILKTGGGKSICFQIPAILAPGKTIIVTPLISLMFDQVRELNDKNIKSVIINSSLDDNMLKDEYNMLKDDNVKMIYISPERLQNKKFINIISKYKISYLIIDEAHTIMWHMDFRESFLNIKEFINLFKYKICIGLFSATVNYWTLKEIKNVVGLTNYNLIKTSFDRPELFYKIYKNVNKINFIDEYLLNNNNQGIIYCQTRKEVMALYDYFKNKYNVTYYHGGLNDEIKMKNQDYFVKRNDVIMISTVAFGMGINKPNIRFIINYNMPDSVESLSQMMGRCSRDGKYGECIILYNDIDLRTLYYFIREIDTTKKDMKEINNIKKYKYISLQSIKKIINSNMCIHRSIAYYFGEKINNCINMCSICVKNIDKKSKII